MNPVRPVPNDGAFDLREVIRDVLASTDDPDPTAVATEVVGLLPGSLIDRLLFMAVRETVCKEISASRSAHYGSPGVSRWTRHRVSVEGLSDRISVSGEWKWVADCTADDLDVYAGEQRERARQIDAHADVAARLADDLRSAGVETVAALFASREAVAA